MAEGSYFYDAVLCAVNHNPQITNGTDKGIFEPFTDCTRAQAIPFLYRAAGSPGVDSAGTSFSDVPENEFYASAVKWAVANGITNGTSETEFSPNETCQRAQIVTFIYRADT